MLAVIFPLSHISAAPRGSFLAGTFPFLHASATENKPLARIHHFSCTARCARGRESPQIYNASKLSCLCTVTRGVLLGPDFTDLINWGRKPRASYQTSCEKAQPRGKNLSELCSHCGLRKSLCSSKAVAGTALLKSRASFFSDLQRRPLARLLPFQSGAGHRRGQAIPRLESRRLGPAPGRLRRGQTSRGAAAGKGKC